MSLSVLRWTTAAGPEEFCNLFTARGAENPRSFDMIGGNGIHYPESGERVVGSGSALFLLDQQGSNRLQRDPRTQQYLTYLLHQLIRLIKGEEVDFLGICFSAQALSVALNALANLTQKGVDPHEIATPEDLEEKLQGFPWEEIWEAQHPMAIATRPEFGVLPNTIADTGHPLLQGVPPPTVRLIHVNKQVIQRQRFERAADQLKTWLKIQLLLTREVRLNGDLSPTPIVTGFRVERTKGRGSMTSVQGHPEWPGSVLAPLLQSGMLDANGQYRGYLGMEEPQVAAGIQEIANTQAGGHQLLENWLQRTALAA